MKKENQISPKVISLSFAVIVMLFVTAFYIFAWTEPTTAPPGGNVAVPINTGSDSQFKTGKLGASTTGIDASYGLTVGSSGIKATGVSYFESSADSQLTLKGTDSWAGLTFSDVAGTDYIWYNGANSTFAIGGGGSNVSGKKLHINGGTSIGSSYAASSVPVNGLAIE
ncbi:MAG: hypothetical protein NTY11_02710, partial [Candidatus Parcubacteria bacterium]|nr:hypothetical protein [Candidatus Parcubacteria bacterium]